MLGQAINCSCHFWKNLFAGAIYHQVCKIFIERPVMANGKNKFRKNAVLQWKVWKQTGYQCDLCRGGINSYR